jgi:ferredoxin-NADP reductase/Na+-translocating ferredoxin:NAD+ oxidoreductase RnfD subunit
LDFIFSTLFFIFFCIFTNEVFARVFGAPSNMESVYITALILALIVTPIQSLNQLLFLFFASGLAMASKYILAINKKHIFNPAAISVAIMGITIGQAASWWVGNIYMMPFVLITGILITRKIRKADLVISFFTVVTVTIVGHSLFTGQSLLGSVQFILFYSFVLFMGFIMFTEPMTTPPTKGLRIIYGAIVGFLSAPFIHLANFYFTPEIALLAGNAFSYIVSPKEKLVLRLKEKIMVANDTYNFLFKPDRKLKFKPGQYLEWTLPHEKRDSRGTRRYFTIASSPTEDEIAMGVKFYDKPSSYKKALMAMNEGGTIIASQLAGDFTLPRDKNKKLIFIAGGIGITPFRSMIKYLMDSDEKRNIIIFYSNKVVGDIAYKQIFEQAEMALGIKTVYSLTDLNFIPTDWRGEKGFVDKKMIEKWVPDFKDRMFYISGPRSMVVAFQKTLKDSGIKKNNIKTDFFPGFV